VNVASAIVTMVQLPNTNDSSAISGKNNTYIELQDINSLPRTTRRPFDESVTQVGWHTEWHTNPIKKTKKPVKSRA
ncbi:MAG: hypothetical protein WBM25_01465, partial [Azonexus sp.]